VQFDDGDFEPASPAVWMRVQERRRSGAGAEGAGALLDGVAAEAKRLAGQLMRSLDESESAQSAARLIEAILRNATAEAAEPRGRP